MMAEVYIIYIYVYLIKFLNHMLRIENFKQ